MARVILSGVVALALLACGEEKPTDRGVALNTDARSHNMGSYLVREWDPNLRELLYTNERVNVWIDWRFLESVVREDGRLQINGTYDIELANTTERVVGALLIRLSFRNARNGSVYEFVYDPERQFVLDPKEVVNVDGAFHAVVDDLAQAETIAKVEVGVQFTFSGDGRG